MSMAQNHASDRPIHAKRQHAGSPSFCSGSHRTAREVGLQVTYHQDRPGGAIDKATDEVKKLYHTIEEAGNAKKLDAVMSAFHQNPLLLQKSKNIIRTNSRTISMYPLTYGK